MLDETLSKAFRPLTLGLDALVGGNPDDPRRRRLFAETPSVALNPTVGDGQAQFVKDVLKVLAEDADFVTLQVHIKPIAAARDELVAKIGERGDLMAKVALAESAQAKTVQAACLAHNDAEPDVKKAVGSSNKKLVESFFYKFPKAKKKQGEP